MLTHAQLQQRLQQLITEFDAPAPPRGSITAPQTRALVNLVKVLGKKKYHAYKRAQAIPAELPISHLSKQQAWLLINAITSDIGAK